MASAMGSSTSVAYTPPPLVASQQVRVGGKDSDGDNDGSKVGEVEKPKAASGNVGTVVNTIA